MEHLCCMSDGQPATYTCACNLTLQYFCRAHITDHLDTEGMHSSRKIHTIAPGNDAMCGLCMNRPACDLCCCHFPVVLLCEEHRNIHILQEPAAVHSFFPVSQKGKIQSSEDLAAIREKVKGLFAMEQHFQAQIDKVSKCEDAVNARFEELKQKLADAHTSFISQLATLKSNYRKIFSEAFENCRANLCEKDYKSKNDLEGILNTFVAEKKPADLEIFWFEVKPATVNFDLNFGVKWESCLDPVFRRANPPRLAILHPSDLCLYDHYKSKWTKVQLSNMINVNCSSAYVFLPGWEIVSTGGNPSGARREAYKIDIKTGSVTILESMLTPRFWHSLYYFNGWIFAFGGHCQNLLKDCEKYNLSTNKWTQIQPMHAAREAFTICEYKGLVYLISGHCVECETFDLVSESFCILPLTIGDGNCDVVAAICGDDLIVITTSNWHRIDLDTYRIKSTTNRKGCGSHLTTQPVLFHQELLFTSPYRFDGVTRFNIVTGERKEDIRIIIE